MPPRISILGRRFGRLEVVSESDEDGYLLGTPSNRLVKVRCDCGTTKTTSARSVRRGHTVSCGCAQRESAYKHGLSSHPLYAVLGSMKARCYQPTAVMYPCYGARGIEVCEEWRNDPSAFVEWGEANGYSRGLEIDRIDVDGDYEPGNCRFVTTTQNARNKRDNRVVAFRGRSVSLAQVAEDVGISYEVIYQRVAKLGWDIERAATTPTRPTRKRSA